MPFNCTVEADSKPVPVSVMTVGLPSSTGEGQTEMSVGAAMATSKREGPVAALAGRVSACAESGAFWGWRYEGSDSTDEEEGNKGRHSNNIESRFHGMSFYCYLAQSCI